MLFLIHNALKRANKTYYKLFAINLNLAFEFNLNTNTTLKPPGPQIDNQNLISRTVFSTLQYNIYTEEINYVNHNGLFLYHI